MNSDNQDAYQQQSAHNDEISLVDIFLTIKRNSKLFFTVIILSFFISLAITYSKYKSEPQTKARFSTPVLLTEHVLIIEIGRIYGENARQNYIDQPINTLEKIKNIYIPKLNQHAIEVEYIKKSDLIVIIATEVSDKVDYNEILLTLADYVLKDHNSRANLHNKNSIIPTRIIQYPNKRLVENQNQNQNQNQIKKLIPVFGIVLGILLGFFAVFINEFIKKVKEAEKSI